MLPSATINSSLKGRVRSREVKDKDRAKALQQLAMEMSYMPISRPNRSSPRSRSSSRTCWLLTGSERPSEEETAEELHERQGPRLQLEQAPRGPSSILARYRSPTTARGSRPRVSAGQEELLTPEKGSKFRLFQLLLSQG